MAFYGTLPAALAYHAARGNGAWVAEGVTDDLRSAALTRASDAIDGAYGARFPGYPTTGRTQERLWPRFVSDDELVTDLAGNEIPDDEVPREIEFATYEAALRELVSPGSMAPDLDRGGLIKSLKAGSVALEYADGAPAETTISAIERWLGGLLIAVPSTTTVSWPLRA